MQENDPSLSRNTIHSGQPHARAPVGRIKVRMRAPTALTLTRTPPDSLPHLADLGSPISSLSLPPSLPSPPKGARSAPRARHEARLPSCGLGRLLRCCCRRHRHRRPDHHRVRGRLSRCQRRDRRWRCRRSIRLRRHCCRLHEDPHGPRLHRRGSTGGQPSWCDPTRAVATRSAPFRVLPPAPPRASLPSSA